MKFSRLFSFILVFAAVGIVSLALIRAETLYATIEAENSQTIVSPLSIQTDSNASGGKYLQFGQLAAAAPSVAFQPSAPFYATFFYPWYKNSVTDGSYSYWQDLGNKPPSTWFAHYLPDINPQAFDPTNELYSSNDYATFKWQAAKLAEAKMEVSIASWFGQGSKQDISTKTYLHDFMFRSDNPYPNLRWALYYECEGITTAQSPDCTSSTGNPPVTQIVADLSHIKNNLSNSPYFLKINNKPVIFVYGDAEGPETSSRWKEANAQTGNAFYIVLKVYTGYQTDLNQPDSWHQYGPAKNYGSHGNYSAYVSPGFWKDAPGEVVRLGRDLNRFKSDVTTLVNAAVTWKLVQTWNEWGEGSSVEPGTQTIIDASGKEVADPNGTPFGNNYVQTLGELLPALEQGTGKLAAAEPIQTVATASQSNVLGTSAFVFTAGGDSGIRVNADASLAKVDSSGAAYHLMLGDLDYDDIYAGYVGTNDADYCAYVKSRLPTLGSNFPFQIVSGNHEEQGGPHGYIMNHAACLPDRMNSTGEYARQYFFDYPTVAPNTRTIMLAANLKVENISYVYTKGSVGYNWVAKSIDDARAAGIKWIVVGMHKTCISAGEKASCEIGKDLFNLLLEKKVDIVLQGHDHNYQRSKQLALSNNCPTIVTSGFDADCVVGSSDVYKKGDGPVVLINGVFGKCCYATSSSDTEVGYFAKYIGANTSGVLKFQVTDESITGNFVNSSGTFTDAFSISSSLTVDTTPPVVTLISPQPNATLSGVIPISATASDNTEVQRVDFLINGTVVNSDTAQPYAFSWDTSVVANGIYTLQARVYDSSGNQAGSNPINASVQNGCSVPTNVIGSVSYTVNVPQTGSYKVWARMMAPSTANDSFFVSTGSTTCAMVVGDTGVLAANQWVWVNTTSAAQSTLTLPLNQGVNTLTLNGREAGVKLDRILFLSDTCVPSGIGDNCTSTADTTAPNVTLTSPTNGTDLSGSVSMSATASDSESGIDKVEFYIDTILVGSDTLSPYSLNYDLSPEKPGGHVMSAKAFNKAGLYASTQITINVLDVTAPNVSIAEPINGASVSSNLKISASAKDNGTLSKVEFYVDGSLTQTVSGIGPYSVSWDTWQVANGVHAITAKAYDTSGNSALSAQTSVTVDNDITVPTQPIAVSATYQANGGVLVTWNPATDNVAVVGYFVLRNGVVIKDTENTASSYLDVNVSADATFRYAVIAYDANRNQSVPSTEVSITTPQIADTSAPTAPSNLVASVVSASQINLSWGASTDTGGSGLQAYQIFRNGILTATIQTTTYGDNSLSPQTSYNYYVIAVDGAKNSSQPSATVTAQTLVSQTSNLTFSPSADASVKLSRANRNYGTTGSIEIDADPFKQSFIKFDVGGLGDRTVVRAIISLKVADPSSAGGTFFKTTTDWSESSITWNNRPTLDTRIGSIGNAIRGNRVEIDVTTAVTRDGSYSFGISSASSNGVDYASREATLADRPQLILIVR